jgi:hypothetical protein
MISVIRLPLSLLQRSKAILKSRQSSTAGAGPTGCTIFSMQYILTFSIGWPIPMLM